MRDDKPSATAAMVAAARAAIHRSPTVEGFEDPYAERLIPASYRRRALNPVVRSLSRPVAHLFALRTRAIDEGIRRAPALEQLVILGAGLDARAWRLDEVAEIPVFEVDHPSTQRYKRERAADFESRPKHHYVPVNFERDSLADELEATGHDPDRPTVWVWEGVTMYLDHDAIDATLGAIEERSAPESRLLVTYIQPSLIRTLVGVGTSFFSEPMRSGFRPSEMRERLARFGFSVTSDESAVDWHRRWATGVRLPWLVSDAEHLAAADKL